MAVLLLIGGSADALWDGGRKAETAGTFVEIPDANHSLQIPDNWRASLDVHTKVFANLDGFLSRGLLPPVHAADI